MARNEKEKKMTKVVDSISLLLSLPPSLFETDEIASALLYRLYKSSHNHFITLFITRVILRAKDRDEMAHINSPSSPKGEKKKTPATFLILICLFIYPKQKAKRVEIVSRKIKHIFSRPR